MERVILLASRAFLLNPEACPTFEIQTEPIHHIYFIVHISPCTKLFALKLSDGPQ